MGGPEEMGFWTGVELMDILRLVAAVVVPFLAVWFATKRGLKNAERFFEHSQNDKAQKLFSAVSYEMLQNRMAACAALSEVMDQTNTGGTVKVEVAFDRTVYSEAAKEIARIEHGPQLVEFYGSLKRFEHALKHIGTLGRSGRRSAEIDLATRFIVIDRRFSSITKDQDMETEFADEVVNEMGKRVNDLLGQELFVTWD